MRTERRVRTILYLLLIAALVLLASHLEYQQIQEDIQSQADCRIKDSEQLIVNNNQ